jgi:hypothetical protein
MHADLLLPSCSYSVDSDLVCQVGGRTRADDDGGLERARQDKRRDHPHERAGTLKQRHARYEDANAKANGKLSVVGVERRRQEGQDLTRFEPSASEGIRGSRG